MFEKGLDLFLGPAGRGQRQSSGRTPFRGFLRAMGVHHLDNGWHGAVADAQEYAEFSSCGFRLPDHVPLLDFDETL